MRKFKDCTNCGRRKSMVMGVNGWICINCFKRIPYVEEEVKEDAKAVTPTEL